MSGVMVAVLTRSAWQNHLGGEGRVSGLDVVVAVWILGRSGRRHALMSSGRFRALLLSVVVFRLTGLKVNAGVAQSAIAEETKQDAAKGVPYCRSKLWDPSPGGDMRQTPGRVAASATYSPFIARGVPSPPEVTGYAFVKDNIDDGDRPRPVGLSPRSAENLRDVEQALLAMRRSGVRFPLAPPNTLVRGHAVVLTQEDSVATLHLCATYGFAEPSG
ncbi:MAG: hypothetical protein WA892_10960, partial [Ornithinimicrobium sp.]